MTPSRLRYGGPGTPPTSPGAVGAESALALVAYTAVAAVFFKLELLDGPKTESAAAIGDLLAYYFPSLKYGFAELAAGRLPLWNAHQSCGSPFIAALHEGFFYPLYAPFLLLPADLALNVHIALHLTLASLGVFALCRRFGMGVAAALLAGLVYAYQGSMMIKVYFPDFLTSSAWIPWLILVIDRTLAQPTARSAAALAAVLGVSILGGHGVQFHYFTALGALPLIAVGTARRLRQRGARALVGSYAMLGVGAALGVAIGMVRLLPSAEFVGQSWRPPGSFDIEVADKMAINPVVFREALLTPEPSPIAGSFSPRSLDKMRRAYFGIVPLALAIVGIALWRPHPIALAVAAAGVFGVLYAFGSASFVYPFLFRLPAGSWFRVVDRALILFGLAVAVLCGAGLDVILERGTAPVRAADRGRLPILVLAVASVAIVVALGIGLGAPRGFARIFWYGGITAALLAALAVARSSAIRIGAAAVLAVLVLVDLFHAQEHLGRLPSELRAFFARNDDFYEAIRARQGLDRTHIWQGFKKPNPLSFHSDTAKAGMNHGIWMDTDYEPLSGARFTRYLKELGFPGMNPIGYSDYHLNARNMPLVELMGVRFFLLDDEHGRRQRAAFPELASRWSPILQRDGVSLYEYAGAMPRAFVVEQVELEADPERLIGRMLDANLRSVAFVEEPYEGRREESGAPLAPARIVDYQANRVAIETGESSPQGLLVLTDQYDAGWQATVDGAGARVLRADFLFRGVPVPAGRHRIELVYRPASFTAGAIGTLAGSALTAAFALMGGASSRGRG